MADNVTTLSEPSPVFDDLSKVQTTENIVHKEPPRYGFLNPVALQSPAYPNTVQNPAQWRPMYNAGSPPTYGHPNAMMMQPTGSIETYQAWSVFNILCCCLLLGFVACYYSSETEELRQRGDLAGAMDASKTARNVNIVATVIGVIAIIIIVIIFSGAL